MVFKASYRYHRKNEQQQMGSFLFVLSHRLFCLWGSPKVKGSTAQNSESGLLPTPGLRCSCHSNKDVSIPWSFPHRPFQLAFLSSSSDPCVAGVRWNSLLPQLTWVTISTWVIKQKKRFARAWKKIWLSYPILLGLKALITYGSRHHLSLTLFLS